MQAAIPAVLVVCLALLSGVRSSSWNYGTDASNGGLPWSDYSTCTSGTSQSPIDVPGTLGADLEIDDNLGEFDFDDYDETDDSWTITNNGHTLAVTVGGERTMSGGDLGSTYKLAQFHFHWGADDSMGSEHEHDGTAFPLELHFVHYKDTYADLTAAVTGDESDSLAVLSVMFEISPRDNDDIAHLTDVSGVVYADDETTMTPFDLETLIPRYTDYYRYSGSLTTPSCNEIVTWTLFTRTIAISTTQMAEFRALYSNEEGATDEALEDNFRPVQDYNGRVVKMSPAAVNSSPLLSISSAMVFMLAVLFMIHI